MLFFLLGMNGLGVLQAPALKKVSLSLRLLLIILFICFITPDLQLPTKDVNNNIDLSISSTSTAYIEMKNVA